MYINDLLTLIILVIISAFFSGSELAFVVSNKIKVEIKARRHNPAAQSALYFTEHPQNFFSTILIGNNIVNVAFASLSTVVLSSVFGLTELNILIISTFILLVFGELIPKYFARELADRIIIISAIPLRITSLIFYPLVKITASLSSLLTHSANVTEESVSKLFSKEDIELLVNESREAGIVNKKESDIINKVLELGDQRVYEAMRPRTEIVGVEMNQSITEALDIFIESGYSKLPVYDGSLDNIKGVIIAYDIFKTPLNLKSIMREIAFVPETKRSIDMLNEFLSGHTSIAIVIDEFGGTAGIVTIEDIIEELLGEIKDEYDVDEEICRKVAQNIYLISGKVEIDFINEKYNLNIPAGDFGTIAGFIIDELGRIPAQGENIVIYNFTILIVRASPTKVDLIKLTVNTEQ